jgi:hypothetical protein
MMRIVLQIRRGKQKPNSGPELKVDGGMDLDPAIIKLPYNFPADILQGAGKSMAPPGG